MRNDKVKRFLALTSIDEAMDCFAEEIIYIEDGCLKKKTEMEGFKCVDSPFRTTKEVLEHIQISAEAYENILGELSIQLNKIHNIDLSQESWRVILHIWLPYYMEEMYSKYLHVKKASADYDNLYTNILAEDSFIHPYYGYGCWIWSLKREDYNFQLYSHIAQFLQLEIKSKIGIQNIFSPQVKKRRQTKEKLFNIFGKRANTIVVNPHNFDLTFLDLFKMIFRSKFRMGFFFPEGMACVPREYDETFRKDLRLEVKENDSEYVRLIKEYIFVDIPTMYLEGLKENIKVFEKYQCKSIISAEDYVYYPAALLMGINRNNQGKLYTIPLGGDGNIWQGISEACMDALISDVLYTTGWKDNSFKCELRRITNPRYWRAKRNVRCEEKKCDILYLASPLFAYRTLISNVNSIFSKEFMDDNISLVKALVHKKLKVRARLYMDTGWGLEERIKDLGNNVEIDDYSRSFTETVFESKLCVMDSFGTAWAEAVAMNIPFVIVVPKYMEFFTEAGWELVHKFQKIGIYFNCYQEAAENISKIVNCIDSWWKDGERQKVITQIGNEYAWCAEDVKGKWIEEFINISHL